MKIRNKVVIFLLNLDVLIASISLILLVGITFLGVIMRYVLGNPLGWIEEVQVMLIVWTVFAAGGAAYRTGNHCSIEIVYELFPKYIQKLVRIFIGIVVTIVVGYLFYSSIKYMQLFIVTGRTTAVMHISFVAIYTIVPISCFLQVLNYFLVKVFGYEEEIDKLVEEEGNYE